MGAQTPQKKHGSPDPKKNMGAQTPQKKHGSPDPKALVMEEKNMGAQTPKLPEVKKKRGSPDPKVEKKRGSPDPKSKTWEPRPQGVFHGSPDPKKPKKICPRGLSIEVLAWTPET